MCSTIQANRQLHKLKRKEKNSGLFWMNDVTVDITYNKQQSKLWQLLEIFCPISYISVFLQQSSSIHSK